MGQKSLQPVGQSNFAIGHSQKSTVSTMTVHEHQCATRCRRHTASNVFNHGHHGARRHPYRAGTPGMFIALGISQRWQKPNVQPLSRSSIDGGDTDCIGNGQISDQWQMGTMLFDGTNRLHQNRRRRQHSGDIGSGEMGKETILCHGGRIPVAFGANIAW